MRDETKAEKMSGDLPGMASLSGTLIF